MSHMSALRIQLVSSNPMIFLHVTFRMDSFRGDIVLYKSLLKILDTSLRFQPQ